MTEDVTGEWDHVAHQLQAWRRASGNPSYNEIAARISANRQLDGMPAAASRIGRTTVYDAFRMGRSRINFDLVREIGQALDVERAAVTTLLEEPSPPPVVVAPLVEPKHQPIRYDLRASLVIMVGCIVLNGIGREIVDLLELPLFLDMVGTALAAVVLGPWRGAAVGALTNMILFVVTGWVSVPFAIVNVAGALIWGYGVRHWGLGRTFPRFFALSVAVAVACSTIAVPIDYFLFDGTAGHQQVHLTSRLLDFTSSFATALTWANVLTSLADKLISGFVALVGATMLGHSIAGIATSTPVRADLRTAGTPWRRPPAWRGRRPSSR
jgi:energy-coupling factor transport system substrate-specific component